MQVLKRYNDGTPANVTLGFLETIAWKAFVECLDQGMDIAKAIAKVRRQWPSLSEEFFQWLGR